MVDRMIAAALLSVLTVPFLIILSRSPQFYKVSPSPSCISTWLILSTHFSSSQIYHIGVYDTEAHFRGFSNIYSLKIFECTNRWLCLVSLKHNAGYMPES